MITLWTAFLWGTGVSVGASIGMMLFAVMFGLFRMASQSEAVKKAECIAELSLAALDRRNELTVEQMQYLDRIAAAIEHP